MKTIKIMEEMFDALSPEQQKHIQDLTVKFDNELRTYEFVEEVGGGAVAVKMKYPGTVTKVYINCEFEEKNKAIIEDLIPLAIANALKSLYAYEDDLIAKMNKELQRQFEGEDEDLNIVKRFGDIEDDKETLN